MRDSQRHMVSMFCLRRAARFSRDRDVAVSAVERSPTLTSVPHRMQVITMGRGAWWGQPHVGQGLIIG